MPDKLPPQVPRTLKNYRLLSRLGAGGMGAVFEAEDRRDRSRVAVKLLHPHLADDEGFRERFEREAHVAALLRSPYTVHLLDYGRAEGYLFLVMELIGGRPLSSIIEEGPLEPTRALRLATEVARALEEADARGVVHRDIKPENILIGDEDSVKVADFGIARRVGGGGITEHGGFVGSVLYAAPEQARGEADHRADIYALGGVLYTMLAGHPPYQGAPLEVLRRHSHESLPVGPLANLPDAVVNIIRRCMEKDPQDRYQSASDMAGALERARRFMQSWEPLAAQATGATAISADSPTVDEESQGTVLPDRLAEGVAETVTHVNRSTDPEPEAPAVTVVPPAPTADGDSALASDEATRVPFPPSPETAVPLPTAAPTTPPTAETSEEADLVTAVGIAPLAAETRTLEDQTQRVVLQASLTPSGSPSDSGASRFRLSVAHESGRAVRVALRATDPGGYRVRMPTSISVAPGSTASVDVRVEAAKRRRDGEDIVRPFELTLEPEAGEPSHVRAEFRDRPRGGPARGAKIGIGAAALALLAVGGALAIDRWRGDDGGTDPPSTVTASPLSAPELVAVLEQELVAGYASIADSSIRSVQTSSLAREHEAEAALRVTLRRTGSGEAVDFLVFPGESQAQGFQDAVAEQAGFAGRQECRTGDRLAEAAVTGQTTTCYGRSGTVVVISSMRVAAGADAREAEARLALERGLQVADALSQGQPIPQATRVPARPGTATTAASETATAAAGQTLSPATPTLAPAVANSIAAGSWFYDFEVISNNCVFGLSVGGRFQLEFLLEEVVVDDGFISPGELVDITEVGADFFVGRLAFTYPEFTWIVPVVGGGFDGLAGLTNTYSGPNSGSSSLFEVYDLGNLGTCEIFSID